jgi:hypothetical protein
MVCSKCGAAYRPGFTVCVDCGVPLVEPPVDRGARPGESTPAPASEPVTVFRSGDSATVALARSILESAEIPFVMTGETLQYALGEGALPGVIDPAERPVEFQVSPDDLERARDLLEVLTESAQQQDVPGEDDEEA